MNVALILTGLARNWEMAFPSFKNYVLDRYETNVYIDIWSETGFYSGINYLPETKEGYIQVKEGDKGFHTSGEIVDVKKMIEMYNPISIRIDRFDVFEPMIEERAKPLINAYTRPKNTVAQAYKAGRGVELFLDYNKLKDVDLIVRARPDIVLEQDPGYWSRDYFYTLPSRNKRNQGTGDSIQIGSSYNIVKFTNYQFSNLEKMYNEIGYSCPHIFAEKTIIDCGLYDIWKEMRIGARVVHSLSGIPYDEPKN